MNLRRALAWMRNRLADTALVAGLYVRVDGRMVKAADGADVDAWLAGEDLPSRIHLRETGAARLAALGGDVG